VDAHFIGRVSENELAIAVNLADITDNLDPERLARLPTDEAARLKAKYTEALVLLGHADMAPALAEIPDGSKVHALWIDEGGLCRLIQLPDGSGRERCSWMAPG
jgi:hypothetical protein